MRWEHLQLLDVAKLHGKQDVFSEGRRLTWRIKGGGGGLKFVCSADIYLQGLHLLGCDGRRWQEMVPHRDTLHNFRRR